MRAVWKKNKVISINLDTNIYSLAQMVNNSALMQFFDIFHHKDEWESIDLNKAGCLFLVAFGNIVIQRLGIRKLSRKEAIPKKGDWNHFFIRPFINAEGVQKGEFLWLGGELVDVGKELELDPYYAPVVVPELKIPEHCDLIINNEFDNMYGDTQVKDRLLRFYKEGINEEHMKEKVFPDLYKCKTRV